MELLRHADDRACSKPQISVCVCTFRRPAQLAALLEKLDRQLTKDLFKFSIVVVDNDVGQSARSVVESLSKRVSVPIIYEVEPFQNIARARNASFKLAEGDLVAFVDDDEEPCIDWLCRLYEVLMEHQVDGVLGPVLPRFEDGAPNWAVKGRIFQRPGFTTGTRIHWSITGTGNVLLKREVLSESDGPFNIQLGSGGEDTDFFRRAMSRGRIFLWSAEAVCYERVPAERTRIGFQLRRALLRGKIASHGPGAGWKGTLKSAVAVPLYVLALPLCLLAGSHLFVTYLVRSFDHLGKLLAMCGIEIGDARYITEANRPLETGE